MKEIVLLLVFNASFIWAPSRLHQIIQWLPGQSRRIMNMRDNVRNAIIDRGMKVSIIR
jgi:hypothetical protein